MKDIAIYGAGGFGREIACLLKHINDTGLGNWNLVGFFDDGKEIGESNGYGAVIGGVGELNAYSKPLSVAMAINNLLKDKGFIDKDNKNADKVRPIYQNILKQKKKVKEIKAASRYNYGFAYFIDTLDQIKATYQ